MLHELFENEDANHLFKNELTYSVLKIDAENFGSNIKQKLKIK